MAAPAWLTGLLAALMLTVAVYCAGRLAAARRWRRPTEVGTDVGHVLMGLAMAGLLVTRLRILPATTWEAVFAAGAAWFAWRLLQSRRLSATSWRCRHPAPTWSSAQRCSACSASCPYRSRAAARRPA
jgi:hypothetical protein